MTYEMFKRVELPAYEESNLVIRETPQYAEGATGNFSPADRNGNRKEWKTVGDATDLSPIYRNGPINMDDPDEVFWRNIGNQYASLINGLPYMYGLYKGKRPASYSEKAWKDISVAADKGPDGKRPAHRYPKSLESIKSGSGRRPYEYSIPVDVGKYIGQYLYDGDEEAAKHDLRLARNRLLQLDRYGKQVGLNVFNSIDPNFKIDDRRCIGGSLNVTYSPTIARVPLVLPLPDDNNRSFASGRKVVSISPARRYQGSLRRVLDEELIHTYAPDVFVDGGRGWMYNTADRIERENGGKGKLKSVDSDDYFDLDKLKSGTLPEIEYIYENDTDEAIRNYKQLKALFRRAGYSIKDPRYSELSIDTVADELYDPKSEIRSAISGTGGKAPLWKPKSGPSYYKHEFDFNTNNSNVYDSVAVFQQRKLMWQKLQGPQRQGESDAEYSERMRKSDELYKQLQQARWLFSVARNSPRANVPPARYGSTYGGTAYA